MDDSHSMIDIGSVRNLVCAKHERALALDHSVNSMSFPIAVFQEAMADPRMTEHCHAGTPEENLSLAGPFIQANAPVCEWITEEARQRAWQKAREDGATKPN